MSTRIVRISPGSGTSLSSLVSSVRTSSLRLPQVDHSRSSLSGSSGAWLSNARTSLLKICKGLFDFGNSRIRILPEGPVLHERFFEQTNTDTQGHDQRNEECDDHEGHVTNPGNALKKIDGVVGDFDAFLGKERSKLSSQAEPPSSQAATAGPY